MLLLKKMTEVTGVSREVKTVEEVANEPFGMGR